MGPILRQLLRVGAEPGRDLRLLLTAKRRIIDALLQVDGLAAAAPSVLEALGESLGASFAALWVPDASGEHLRCIGTWHATGFRGRTLSEALHATVLPAGRGLAGRTWRAGKVTSFPSLTEDAEGLEAGAARAAGLKSALVLPILTGESFQGAIELYDGKPLPADETRLLALEVLGRVLGSFVSRQRALRHLTASEADLADLFEHTPMALTSTDARGTILRANAATLALLGRPATEVVGRRLADLCLDPRSADAVLAELSGGAAQAERDLEVRRPDGGRRWLRVIASALRRDGTPHHVRAALHDVTDELALQTRLAATERRYFTLADGVRDRALITFDLEGRITSWNAGAERMFGLHAQEALGSEFGRTYAEADREAGLPARLVKRALDEGELLHEGWRVRDGTARFWAETLMATVRDDAGAPVEILDLVQDATERKRMEDLRRRTGDMEAENRAVVRGQRRQEELLHDLARALSKPAGTVSAAAAAVLRAAGEGGPGLGEHEVETLTEGVELLKRTMTRATEAALEAAQRLDLDPRPQDPLRLAVETCDLLRSAAHARLIRLDVDVDPGLTGLVTDGRRFRQVLYNLLTNAVAAGRENGRVGIRIRLEGEHDVRIEVEDNGIGLPPEELAHVFDAPPESEPDAPASPQDLLRLGLAAARRIVEQQGGRVGATSAIGRGSLLFAVLPRSAQVEVPAIPEAPVPEALRVLVVSQDTALRASLAWTIGNGGHSVEVAPDAEAARAHVREQAIDALAVDVGDPDLHPGDLVLDLRREGASRATPCVLAAVRSEAGAPAVLVASDLLPQPCPPDRMLEALERLGIARSRGGPILVVDGEMGTLRATERTLGMLGYRALAEPDAEGALRSAAQVRPAAIVLSPFLLGMDPFTFQAHLARRRSGAVLPLLLMLPVDIAKEPKASRLRALATQALGAQHVDPASFLRVMEARTGLLA